MIEPHVIKAQIKQLIFNIVLEIGVFIFNRNNLNQYLYIRIIRLMYNGIRPVSKYNMTLFVFLLTPKTYLRKSKCIFQYQDPFCFFDKVFNMFCYSLADLAHITISSAYIMLKRLKVFNSVGILPSLRKTFSKSST